METLVSPPLDAIQMSHFRGHRRQIQWATELRAAFFGRIRGVTMVATSDFNAGVLSRHEIFAGKSREEFDEMLLSAYHDMAAISDPQYWIDHRDKLSPIGFILSR